MANPAEKLALVVVLPTPPLPEVTTTIRVMASTSFRVNFKLMGLLQMLLSEVHEQRITLYYGRNRRASVGQWL
jgi:hypothetical protein